MDLVFVTVFFGVRVTHLFVPVANSNKAKLFTAVQQNVGGEWVNKGSYRHDLNPGDGFLMFSTMNAEKEQPTVNADGTLNVPEWCAPYRVESIYHL
jgi:hypothetical protein